MQEQNQLPGSIIDVDLENHLVVEEVEKLWNLNAYQIQSGASEGFIKAIHTPFLQLAYVFRSVGTVLKGEIPENCYMFAFVYPENEGTITHNGLAIKDNALVVLNDKDQVDLMSPQGYRSLSIAVSTDFFDHEYENYFNHSFTYDQLYKRIDLQDDKGTYLKQSLIKLLFHAMKKNVKLREDPDFLQDIEKRTMQILFQSLGTVPHVEAPLDSEKQANIIRVYLNLHLTEELTLQQISQDLHMSGRTIREGFHNLFSMSPKQYLTHYRLGKVHNKLLSSNIKEVTVEQIAYDHGFYHMGHFPKVYREMFGENPSDTLKRSPIMP